MGFVWDLKSALEVLPWWRVRLAARALRSGAQVLGRRYNGFPGVAAGTRICAQFRLVCVLKLV